MAALRTERQARSKVSSIGYSVDHLFLFSSRPCFLSLSFPQISCCLHYLSSRKLRTSPQLDKGKGKRFALFVVIMFNGDPMQAAKLNRLVYVLRA